MKIACTLFLISVCISLVAQNKKNIHGDSVKKELSKDYSEFARKADSLTTAKYHELLERTVTLDTAKDTYYGVVFTAIAIIVTILVLYFGYNFFESRNQLASMGRNATNALNDQVTKYAEAQNDWARRFTELETKANDLMKQNQQNIDNYLNLLYEELSTIKNQTNLETTQTQTEKIEKIELNIKRLQDSNPVKNEKTSKGQVEFFSVDPLGLPYAIKCVSCNHLIYYDPPFESPLTKVVSENPFFSGNVKKQARIKCPNCGTYNTLPPTGNPDIAS